MAVHGETRFVGVDDRGAGGWFGSLGSALLAVALVATALVVASPSPASAAAVSVPGRIEAEDYSSSSDSDAGNQGRASSFVDDVDVWPLIGGGYIVGRVRAGEHTSYEISVAETGRYEFVLRNASGGAGGTVTVSVDGTPIAAAVKLGNTNGWWRFRSTPLAEATMTAGDHTVRVDWGPGQSNFDYLEVNPVQGVSGRGDHSGATTVPGAVEAENYSSYRDTTVGNQGAATEFTDDVDVWRLPSGIGHKLGGVHEGEFTTYDIDVTEAGSFNFALVHASPGPGGTATVSIDGIPLGPPQALGSTGGWTSFQQDHIGNRVLHAGRHELRVDWGSGQSDLDRIEVTRETDQEGSVSGAAVSSVPGIVEAEDYAAFGDADAGNRGRASTYSDHVDVWPTIGGGYIVGRVVEGEYLTYNVAVTEAGTFGFSIRHASGAERGGTATVSVDGEAIAPPTDLGNTNGWWRFATTLVAQTNLSVGTHTVRVDWGPGQSNIDYLEIAPATPASILRVSTNVGGIDFAGRVTDATGGSVTGVQVDLFEAVDEFTRGSFIRSLHTDAKGHFSFESLPPNCYIVVVAAPDGAIFSSGSEWHEAHGCMTVTGDAVLEALSESGRVLYSFDASQDQVTLDNLRSLSLSELSTLRIRNADGTIREIDLASAVAAASLEISDADADISRSSNRRSGAADAGVAAQRAASVPESVYNFNFSPEITAEIANLTRGQVKAYVCDQMTLDRQEAGEVCDTYPANHDVFTSIHVGSKRAASSRSCVVGFLDTAYPVDQNSSWDRGIQRLGTTASESFTCPEIRSAEEGLEYLRTQATEDPEAVPAAATMATTLTVDPLLATRFLADLNTVALADGAQLVGEALAFVAPAAPVVVGGAVTSAALAAAAVVIVSAFIVWRAKVETEATLEEIDELVQRVATRIQTNVDQSNRPGPVVDPELFRDPEVAKKIALLCTTVWSIDLPDAFGETPCEVAPLYLPSEVDLPGPTRLRADAIASYPEWLVQRRSERQRTTWYVDQYWDGAPDLVVEVAGEPFQAMWGCKAEHRPGYVRDGQWACDEFPNNAMVAGGRNSFPTPALRWMPAGENGDEGNLLNSFGQSGFYPECDIQPEVDAFVVLPLISGPTLDFPLPNSFFVCS